MQTRALAAVLLLTIVGAACPSREPPPAPPAQDEPKKEDAPFCGKVFRDAKVRGGAQCCLQPSAGLLKSADVVAACGVAAAAYLGETRDGGACRLHFQAGGGDPKETFVMVSHPVIPAGAPAPMGPDPLLPWKWKKVALRDAIGFEAVGSADEAKLLEKQTILWAGRGRRIIGLHVSKQICTAAQAEALLQKALDAVP
ncbi:MAG TPA: hypothetical protein VN903_29690 [Polyangia bacterium]|jgi:hypothetical protein|nr:hypothetical protein [Polyangia bacterium]